MKTSLLLMAILLSSLPLSAQPTPRRVSAVCQLTTADIVPSSRTVVAPPAREFLLQVINNSNRTVKLPKQPEFGWRVEIFGKRGWQKNVWKLRAEGGPVRLLKAEEQHVVSTSADDGPLVEIEPTQSGLFYFVLPDAKKSLEPKGQIGRVRLSIYWSPSAEEVEKVPEILPCALAATWVVDVQRAPAGE
jgi:hypothetical protein